jgi:hypothetical protein
VSLALLDSVLAGTDISERFSIKERMVKAGMVRP